MKDNIITRLFKKKELDLTPAQQDYLGWHSFGGVDTLKHYRNNQYENGYGSIQAITKQFWQTVPYAVDVNGKRQKQTNVTDVLSRPNKDMSGLDFREALAVMSLVHDKVYLRVWHKGDSIRENTITGFTFLEDVTEHETGRGTTYSSADGGSYTDKDIIVLKGINPYDLNRGYSVANAARRWANIDDYIASYQAGFFENGAIPSGKFLISAPNAAEFGEIVRNLKKKHQGTGKNNNVTYDFAPIDPATGKPTTGAIQWIPFNTSNKDLALKDIFEQVNKKIDSAYGVPASIRGDNDANTYASVRVDQEIFIDYTVRPFAMKVWNRFTHELNRITGGLGYALTFEMESPHIAEEDKAKAETKQITTTTLITLTSAGYTLGSSVKALGLPDEYLLLEIDKTRPAVSPAVTEDEPTVDQGDEVVDAPDAEEPAVKSLDSIDLSCKHCGRYLMKATGTTIVEDMPCPSCKAVNNFKIINPLGDDLTHKFTFAEAEPRDWKYVARSKEMSPEQKALITQKIAATMRKQMEDQINSVDVKTKALGDQDPAKAELYAKEILSIVGPLTTSEGMKQYLLARTIEGIHAEDLNTFRLTDAQLTKYEKYLQGIVKGYAEDTAVEIRKVLDDSIANKLPVTDVKKALSGVMNTDEWRVQRLALSETNRAGNTGSIAAMEQVQKDAKIKINKVWQARNGACEYCRALSGTEVAVSEDFVARGDEIKGADGGVRVNDFGHMDVPTAHSNCGCYSTYKVVKD